MGFVLTTYKPTGYCFLIQWNGTELEPRRPILAERVNCWDFSTPRYTSYRAQSNISLPLNRSTKAFVVYGLADCSPVWLQVSHTRCFFNIPREKVDRACVQFWTGRILHLFVLQSVFVELIGMYVLSLCLNHFLRKSISSGPRLDLHPSLVVAQVSTNDCFVICSYYVAKIMVFLPLSGSGMSWKAPAVSTVLFPVSVDLDSPNPHRLSATQTTNDSVVTSTVPNIPGASAYVVQSNSVSVSHENVSSVELNTWSASSSLNPVSDKENRPPFALSSSATQVSSFFFLLQLSFYICVSSRYAHETRVSFGTLNFDSGRFHSIRRTSYAVHSWNLYPTWRVLVSFSVPAL